MDIQREKFRLIEAVMKIEDVTLIKEIQNLLEDKTDPILGYDLEGKTISRLELIREIEFAEDRVDSGECINQADLEKEAESW